MKRRFYFATNSNDVTVEIPEFPLCEFKFSYYIFSLDDKRFLLSFFYCLVFLFDCDPFPLWLICEGKRSNNAIFCGIRQFFCCCFVGNM